MEALALANALGVGGDLCHRYAVLPFWLRWLVGLPWVGTHIYRCVSPQGLDCRAIPTFILRGFAVEEL